MLKKSIFLSFIKPYNISKFCSPNINFAHVIVNHITILNFLFTHGAISLTIHTVSKDGYKVKSMTYVQYRLKDWIHHDTNLEKMNVSVLIERYGRDPTHLLAFSVGWFVLLLVRLCEREVLLAGLGEQYSCEGAGQPSQLSDHAVGLD